MTRFFQQVLIVASSILCAAVLYFLWMGTFILLSGHVGEAAKGFLWVLAPVVTAAGFAVGLAMSERPLTSRRVSFGRIYVWPLVGCAVGAAAVYWHGPMLIVFGMFLMGTASVVLRQALFAFRG